MAKRQNTKKDKQSAPKAEQTQSPVAEQTQAAEVATDAPAENEAEVVEDPVVALRAELDKQKKEYAFLLAEFDNFRRRVMREKEDLIKNGAQNALKDLLPVVDDFERALAAMKPDSTDIEAMHHGVELIYNKFIDYLRRQHVTAIDSTGNDFDPDLHEAVTTFPAPSPEMKGKVIDTTTKGYMINDKVLRHAKVVVGQ